MFDDEDDAIVNFCVHRKGVGRACAMCLIEAVRDLQLEQERVTRKIFESWEKDNLASILRPNCERG